MIVVLETPLYTRHIHGHITYGTFLSGFIHQSRIIICNYGLIYNKITTHFVTARISMIFALFPKASLYACFMSL